MLSFNNPLPLLYAGLSHDVRSLYTFQANKSLVHLSRYALELYLGPNLAVRGVFLGIGRGPNPCQYLSNISHHITSHQCIKCLLETPSAAQVLPAAFPQSPPLRSTEALPGLARLILAFSASLSSPTLTPQPSSHPPSSSSHTGAIKCCGHHPHDPRPRLITDLPHLRSSTGAPLSTSSTTTPASPARKRPAFCC